MRAAVILASAGRPALLGAAVSGVDALEGEPFTKVVSVPDQASLPADGLPDDWLVVVGTRGLAAQRNAGLEMLTDEEVVVFFDDDAVVRPDYLRAAMSFFSRFPDVVGLTGRVLLDGATTGEIAVAEADAVLAASAELAVTGTWTRTRELYGCNFAVRRSAVPAQRFDDRLPLYSWLEDHDFARRLMRHGTLAKVDDCVIVHRGAASGGRTAHVRLGYSQVMNPVHLLRTGSFPVWLTAWEIFRPTAKNVALSVVGDARDWRRQRLVGNLTAVKDVVRGRITPGRIVDL